MSWIDDLKLLFLASIFSFICGKLIPSGSSTVLSKSIICPSLDSLEISSIAFSKSSYLYKVASLDPANSFSAKNSGGTLLAPVLETLPISPAKVLVKISLPNREILKALDKAFSFGLSSIPCSTFSSILFCKTPISSKAASANLPKCLASKDRP